MKHALYQDLFPQMIADMFFFIQKCISYHGGAAGLMSCSPDRPNWKGKQKSEGEHGKRKIKEERKRENTRGIKQTVWTYCEIMIKMF